MKALIIGQNGQLATALRDISIDQCSAWSKSVRPARGSLNFAGRSAIDLAMPPAQLKSAMAAHMDTDIVINAAAYTHVDRAEEEPELAYKINCQSPAIIARECNDRGVPFIHVSTDYVFDGAVNTPYKTDAPVNPLNVYGQTKADSETAVLEACPDAIIIRTSSVFGARYGNFVGAMEQIFADGKTVRVVDDQIMRPTYADHLGAAILHVADHALTKGARGIYHLTGSGDAVSWKALAEAILAELGLAENAGAAVTGTTSREYGAAAKRPAYSALDMQHFEKTFGIQMPDWRVGLKDRIIYQMELLKRRDRNA